MNLDELAQVGLNAPMPDEVLSMPMAIVFEAGKKAATDHIIAALLRDGAAQLRDSVRPT